MVCLLYSHINLPSAIKRVDEVADGQGRLLTARVQNNSGHL